MYLKMGIMKIGIIRPYDLEYNPPEIEELESSIKRAGHKPSRIYINRLGVSLSRNGVRVLQTMQDGEGKVIDVDGALLRHIGVVRDYEQMSERLWTIKALEDNGAYVMNRVMPWLIASDKLASLSVLARNGMSIPESFSTEELFIAYEAAKRLGRTVVKPLRGAMGFGVFKADNADIAMHAFSSFTNMSKPIYLQRYLDKKGGDYRVVVVGGEVVGAEFRKSDGWKSNISQGATPMATRIDGEMREMAVRATELLGLDYAGIDIAETKDGYFILETNPTMSWRGIKRVSKTNIAAKIVAQLLRRLKE